jgi:DNA-binding NarL/FixJ family response regulator
MDILDYILQVTIAEIGEAHFTPEKRKKIIHTVRLNKGKDKHYLHSIDAERYSERVEAIFSALRKGATPREIAERVGLTHQRVNQIIATVKMPESRLP